ncbi:unnamed protein product [Absidia cylindrospora]
MKERKYELTIYQCHTPMKLKPVRDIRGWILLQIDDMRPTSFMIRLNITGTSLAVAHVSCEGQPILSLESVSSPSPDTMNSIPSNSSSQYTYYSMAKDLTMILIMN